MNQNGRIQDSLTIAMDEKLTQLSNNYRHEPFIHCVYDRLRRQNERAYEPELLAIGPYNRGKPALQVMEEHKRRYLQLLLQRREESSVDRYVTAIRALEERARGCYAEDICLHANDSFVEMLILDGCFIVELCRKSANKSMADHRDVLFKGDYLHHWIWRDMLLFENQIPFFVLDELFNMTKSAHEDREKRTMVDLLLSFYSDTRKYYHYHTKSSGKNHWLQSASRGIDSGKVKHILGLIHLLTTKSFKEKLSSKQSPAQNCDSSVRWEFIHSTTELREAGIGFRAKHDSSLFDITFSNGMLEISLITVDDKTECLLRNLIAYEQSLGNNDLKIVTDYVTLLYCIIKSPRDVSLLRRYGIINNMVGDDEAVSNTYSNTSSCVFVSHDRFCYKEVFNEVNAHCKRRRNIWEAKLRRNYFNSPWTIISFLAALFLLMLTFLQTMVTVLPYLAHLHAALVN
ncbi:UPF0481 protein At3g47200-like [Impatiens glandulifera]|uniref:UPF0481 protein At3g47200-like n=1 Tax=Impatiens glandulifera TaxID=253017 RepID=UPI001FB08FC8|nr:UPF0481 protein At3g47200-like [Impatiens glandulifera]